MIDKLKSHLLITFLTLLICSCGSLRTITTTQAPIILKDQASYKIKALHCNTHQCLTSDTKLHTLLKSDLRKSLSKRGLQETSSDKANYTVSLISAYESKIEKSMPRNIYLILENERGQQLFQLAIAEHFSTPLTKEYISLQKVQTIFNSLLNNSITVPRYVAKNEKRP